MIFYTSCLWAKNSDLIYLPLKPYFTYGILSDKKEAIDTVCRFDPDDKENELKKNEVMARICNFDDTTLDVILTSKRSQTPETRKFFSSCTLLGEEHTRIMIKQYCHFRTSISREKILSNFCAIKDKSTKKGYIQRLTGITNMGAAVQKVINYNRQDELQEKHKEALNPTIYNFKNKPHIEAAYQLGVIHGFSECGMRDSKKALTFFEQALNKPETFFMVAELYRSLNQKKYRKRIYKFYNYAIKVNINKSYYNLALYMYQQLRDKKNNEILPVDFTYQKVIYYMQQAVKKEDVAAYNDLPILISKLYKGYNQKQLQNIMALYFDRAAQKNFKTTLYNQIIQTIARPCTKEGLVLIEQNVKFLLDDDYQDIGDLLLIIKKAKCYKKMAEEFLEKMEDKNRFHHEPVPIDNRKLYKITKDLAYNAFEANEKSMRENIIR
ncbi:MAG: hypothetical protein ACJA1M_000867 [Alphaproteobacteria bacterium]|jgi:hypothetical protein